MHERPLGFKYDSKLTKEERKVQYQGINKEIRDIKNDIITMKIEKSNEKYHKFIK